MIAVIYQPLFQTVRRVGYWIGVVVQLSTSSHISNWQNVCVC